MIPEKHLRIQPWLYIHPDVNIKLEKQLYFRCDTEMSFLYTTRIISYNLNLTQRVSCLRLEAQSWIQLKYAVA